MMALALPNVYGQREGLATPVEPACVHAVQLPAVYIGDTIAALPNEVVAVVVFDSFPIRVDALSE